MPMCLPCNLFLEPRKVTLSYRAGAAPEKHPDWRPVASAKETFATSSALEAQLVLSCCLSWMLKGLRARICKSVASGRGLGYCRKRRYCQRAFDGAPLSDAATGASLYVS